MLAALTATVAETGAHVARENREQAAAEAERYRERQAAHDAETAERVRHEGQLEASRRVPGPAA